MYIHVVYFKQHYSLKMASGCFKMTSEAAGTRFIIFKIKSFPVCRKQGAIPYKAGPAIPYRAWPSIPDKHENGLGRPQNDLGGCWDQAYHFEHQKLPLYVCPKQRVIPYRAWPAILDKHTNTTNEQNPLFFISIYIYCIYIVYIYCIYIVYIYCIYIVYIYCIYILYIYCIYILYIQ